MNRVKTFVFICGTLWLLLGCNSTPKQEPLNPDQVGEDKSSLQNSEVGPAVFEKESHNFGTIRQGEEVSVRFYFTNVGPSPLTIEKVKTGCGCTVANYPREPVRKDERKFVEVIFNSQGRKGLQYQEVSVLFANNRQSPLLTIVARVREN